MSGSSADAGFAAQLRHGTRVEHEQAENTAFVAALLGGELPIAAYVAYLNQLYHVYQALEGDRSAVRADATAAALLDPALDRTAALAADLRYLAGPEWRGGCTPARETQQYCDRITEVRTAWPGGYVAHHYTRYLGDLSGGQVIAGALRRHYGLTGQDGTRFFAFDGISPRRQFKTMYRSTLDETAWDAQERERIIDEARAAFRHNNALLCTFDGWTTAS